jgi:hypothetical protein
MSAGTFTIAARRQASRGIAVEHRVRVADVRQAPVVLGIFMLVQLLDGVLTYWGVNRFGIELEMNTILASSMLAIGPGATLVAAKLIAAAGGLVLYGNGYYRPLAAVSGLCLGLAVVPWLIFWFYTVHL